MTPINYFKLQAKNLFKDYKTQKQFFDKEIGDYLYEYSPKYFDVDGIVLDYDIDEDNFTLMNAQHVIANMAGFEKWTEMLKANQVNLNLAKLLFDNAHKISIDEWEQYIGDAEEMNNTVFDDEAKLGIFEVVFANSDEHRSMFLDYRLRPESDLPNRIQTNKRQHPIKPPTDKQITSLPLDNAMRNEFIKTANHVFKSVISRIGPRNLEQTLALWDAEHYVDNVLLTPDKLPIGETYAKSLIEAFMVHHAVNLAVQADKAMEDKQFGM